MMKLSEHQAYELIMVARAGVRFEKLQTSLEKGHITLGKARRLSSVMTKDNQEIWLKLARTSSQRELEKQIAKKNPRASVKEGATYISERELSFTVGISEETYQLMKRTQDVLSQKRKKSVSWDECLKSAAQAFLDQNDPVKKAERALKRKTKCGNSARAEVRPQAPKGRRLLPAHINHQVSKRDQGKCQGQVLGFGLCEEERFVDFHRIIPVSKGGADTLENLITLCSGHHRVVHEEGVAN